MQKAKDASFQYVEFGRSVLRCEGKAVCGLADRIGDAFGSVCQRIRDCAGAVVVTGVGKAGIIARKVSATMASTGTRSYWLDPVNAMHGDLGMVSPEDVALLLSNSGSSAEILAVAQMLGAMRVHRIAMTRSAATDLGSLCESVLEVGELEEACPLRLAPSTSTTVMLALGDALALAVQRGNGFTESEYARLHPAGALGRRLMRVSHCMRTGERVATATPDTPVIEVLSRITKARCGACVVTDHGGVLLGIYTDGDFRRNWGEGVDLSAARVGGLMTRDCKRIGCDRLVSEALDLMHKARVNALPVVNEHNAVQGLLDIQDLV